MLLKILLKRILYGIVVVMGVMTVLFFVLRVIPGDPAVTIAPTATEERRMIIRKTLDLDKPIVVQFGVFITEMLSGDFGRSFFMPEENILPLVIKRVINSMKIAAPSICIVIFGSIFLGVSSASKSGSIYDRAIMGSTISIQSIPNFWLGLILILIFGVKLGWVPTSGYKGPISIIIPSIVLAFSLLGSLTRLVRVCANDILEQDFIIASRARGIVTRKILYNYAMQNVYLYLLTVASLQFGIMVGGIVILEFVFDYPGLGLLTLNAILRRDYPMIQAIVFIVAIMFVLINIIIDVIYFFIDPRVRKVIT